MFSVERSRLNVYVSGQTFNMHKTISIKKELPCLPLLMRTEKKLLEEDRQVLETQWELFHKLSKIQIPNEIMDRQNKGLLELGKGTLVHGTSYEFEKFRSIRETGILSGEFIGIPEDNETNYCADFFRVPEDMSVQNYISWYSKKEGTFEKMEAKRLPKKTNQRSTKIGIVFSTQNTNISALLENDAYSKGHGKMKRIITRLPYEDESHKTRLAAVLCGIPSNFISALILSQKVIEEQAALNEIRSLFSNVILFNLNGIVV